MTYSANIHVAVYQVLDQILMAQVAPPGAKATIHSIIDDLHTATAPRHMIEKAEDISLQLHLLETAVIRGNPTDASQAHHRLGSIAATWLDHRITG